VERTDLPNCLMFLDFDSRNASICYIWRCSAPLDRLWIWFLLHLLIFEVNINYTSNLIFYFRVKHVFSLWK